jgi:hypothetical protein
MSSMAAALLAALPALPALLAPQALPVSATSIT